MDAHELGDLYQDASFARRLASGLVGEAGSEDVWQEVWYALLTRPAPGGDLRNRLRQLVVRRALNHRRGELRRRRREQAAARDERLPSSEELVARTEIHRAVVDALLGLEEPYRRTLLLIFFEDVDPHEIARREAIPLETVRTRKKRALAQLRERLERAHGDRREWLTGIAALAGLRQEASAATFPAQPRLAAVAGVVVLGAVAWWLGTRRDETRGDSLAREVGPPSSERLDSALEPAVSERDPVAGSTLPRANEPEPLLFLRGRVLDEAKTGILEAELRVRVAGLFSSEAVASGRSDASGRCDFSLPAPSPIEARARSLIVEAWASGFRPTLEELPLAEVEGTIEVELVLEPGRTLEGCVRDERGHPVVGAIVVAHSVSPNGEKGAELGESDDQGEYRIGLAQEDELTEIESWSAQVGTGFLSGAALPLAPEQRAQDLVLEERSVLRGLALHPDGTPARDLQVLSVHLLQDDQGRLTPAPKASVSAGGPARTATHSDQEGRFAVHGLAEGIYAVREASLGFDPKRIAPDEVFHAGREEAHVVVQRHRALLEVVDSTGAALVDVEVAFTPLAACEGGGWKPARKPVRFVTRESGCVGFVCEPSSTVALTALLPGRAVEVCSAIGERPFEVRERVVLAGDEQRGALRLLASDSTPLAGVELQLATAAARIPLSRSWRSGPDGLVREVPAGTFRGELRLASDDPWVLPSELELTIAAGGTQDVQLIPRRGGKLSVGFELPEGESAPEVRSGRHSSPPTALIPGLVVEAPAALWRAEDPAEAPAFLALDSARPGERWTSAQALPPGRYRLEANFAGFEPVHESIVIEAARASEVRISLVGGKR